MEDRKDRQIVRRAFESTLSGLPEDPNLARRVLIAAHAEANAQARGAARKKTASRVVVAFVCLLLFGATAFALARPAVLDWLLGKSPASIQLEEAVQSVSEAGTADGITARITGVVFDGENLAFSYELENSDPSTPVLVAVDSALLMNGRKIRLLHCTAGPDEPQMVPSPHLDVLPVRRNPAAGGGVCHRIGEGLDGSVSCELTFIVYRPENRFAFMLSPDGILANAGQYTGDQRAEIDDSLNTIRSFRNAVIVDAGQTDHVPQLSQDCTIVDESGRLVGFTNGEDPHLAESARIKVTFSFDASNAFSCDFSQMADIALDDCLLHVERFRLSALETSIDLSLIPQENSEQAARALAGKYGAYALTDEQGAPVTYSEMDYLAGNQPDVTQINGQWLCRYLTEMPGLLRFPENIGFTAGGADLFRVDLTTNGS